MKTNKLDNSIKEKFAKRTFEPSASAWERLSMQLDEQPKQKKRGWFFYIGAAASILLLISVSFMYLNKTNSIEPIEVIVDTPIKPEIFDKKLEELKNEIPIEKAIVKIDEVKKEQENYDNVIPKNKKPLRRKINKNNIIQKEENISIAKVVEKQNENLTKEKFNIKKTLKQNPNSRIKINSDDLLYAVTHSKQEVKAYYAKYNVNRDDVLSTIKSELKKSNLKVNPNTILAEVERTIDDDVFQNNFMKTLKRRVTDIASVIASRND